MIRKYPGYYRFFSTRTFTWGKRTHRNTDHLLVSYSGTDGIKTGYIRASGFNLVASAERAGRRLIGVVFGGRTALSRDQHMVKLLEAGFAQIAVSDTRGARTRPGGKGRGCRTRSRVGGTARLCGGYLRGRGSRYGRRR